MALAERRQGSVSFQQHVLPTQLPWTRSHKRNSPESYTNTRSEPEYPHHSGENTSKEKSPLRAPLDSRIWNKTLCNMQLPALKIGLQPTNHAAICISSPAERLLASSI